MIFDYELMFTDKNTAFTSKKTGVLGRSLDLAGPGAGKGFRSYIGFAFHDDVTSGGPVSFELETADNESFTDSVKIPLSMPELKVEDMTAGSVASAPLPVMGMQRYVRLNLNATANVTLTGLECGFLLDTTQR